MVPDLTWVGPLDSMHAQTAQDMRSILEPEYGTRVRIVDEDWNIRTAAGARRGGALRPHGGRHRRRGDRVPPGGHVRVGADSGRPACGAPAPVELMRRAAARKVGLCILLRQGRLPRHPAPFPATQAGCGSSDTNFRPIWQNGADMHPRKSWFSSPHGPRLRKKRLTEKSNVPAIGCISASNCQFGWKFVARSRKPQNGSSF